MSEIRTLANQHFLEWKSRLNHIDEMIGQANALHANAPEESAVHLQITNAKQARERIAAHLAEASALPASELPDDAKNHDGLKSSLDTIGLQLEKILTTVFKGT